MSPGEAAADVECPVDEDTTILFADGDPALLRTYERLYPPECTVLTASKGEAVLDQFESEIDFVFVEQHLPDMSGAELIRTLRDRGYDTPVGIISAVIPESGPPTEHLVHAIKPVDRTDLYRIVEQHT